MIIPKEDILRQIYLIMIKKGTKSYFMLPKIQNNHTLNLN